MVGSSLCVRTASREGMKETGRHSGIASALANGLIVLDEAASGSGPWGATSWKRRSASS
ncbi:hypothetical protein SAMN06295960_3829 [Paenibacillus aquistagni]|uniref:Uncharacterized protein n=1 Tax=Paenibacillus aquistagni TaxID=1852522 RepID=A0A1X7LNU3_9BACL|nr:hypothetical protein SAMN06295960_3829 [Paenibacillus aquistagni]